MVVDDQVRDVARGDGVALRVVLVDGLRQVALLVAGVHISAGHKLAERVQDPLLHRLIVDGTLDRVVGCIGGFPDGLGARFIICRRSGTAAFASRRLGIGTRRRAPGIRRGANNLDGTPAGRRRFARAFRQR